MLVEGGRFDMDFGFFAAEAKWFGRWETKSGALRCAALWLFTLGLRCTVLCLSYGDSALH